MAIKEIPNGRLTFDSMTFKTGTMVSAKYLLEWLSVISWAKQCGIMKQEPSSPTFSTFEEKSLHIRVCRFIA
jgi:hypothetical protein